jgi:hypothetical protein
MNGEGSDFIRSLISSNDELLKRAEVAEARLRALEGELCICQARYAEGATAATAAIVTYLRSLGHGIDAVIAAEFVESDAHLPARDDSAPGTAERFDCSLHGEGDGSICPTCERTP